jgi:hypothetical protein
VSSADAVPDELRHPVTRLVEAYQVGTGSQIGALVHPTSEQVGAEIDRDVIGSLVHALLAGVLANNPRMTAPEEEQDLSAGHAVATSENALVYGHPVTDGDS